MMMIRLDELIDPDIIGYFLFIQRALAVAIVYYKILKFRAGC